MSTNATSHPVSQQFLNVSKENTRPISSDLKTHPQWDHSSSLAQFTNNISKETNRPVSSDRKTHPQCDHWSSPTKFAKKLFEKRLLVRSQIFSFISPKCLLPKQKYFETELRIPTILKHWTDHRFSWSQETNFFYRGS